MSRSRNVCQGSVSVTAENTGRAGLSSRRTVSELRPDGESGRGTSLRDMECSGLNIVDVEQRRAWANEPCQPLKTSPALSGCYMSAYEL